MRHSAWRQDSKVMILQGVFGIPNAEFNDLSRCLEDGKREQKGVISHEGIRRTRSTPQNFEYLTLIILSLDLEYPQ
jgi:hypothetical protein